MCEMKFIIHSPHSMVQYSQISTVQLLKFGNGWVISSHTFFLALCTPEFHGSGGHNKCKYLQDRASFHWSRAWQIVLIFKHQSFANSWWLFFFCFFVFVLFFEIMKMWSHFVSFLNNEMSQVLEFLFIKSVCWLLMTWGGVLFDLPVNQTSVQN